MDGRFPLIGTLRRSSGKRNEEHFGGRNVDYLDSLPTLADSDTGEVSGPTEEDLSSLLLRY